MNHRKFTVDQFLGLLQPTARVPLHLSPDGQKLVVTRQQGKHARNLGSDLSYTATGIPKGAIGSRLFVVDTSTGIAEEPFPSSATSWGAQWSPDGSLLATYVQYEGQACLGIWERASEQYRLYPHVLVRPFFGFEVPCWTSDSQSLVVKLIASKHSTKDTVEKRNRAPATVFSFIPGVEQEKPALPGWADGYICDLAMIDVTTGEVRRLAEDWRVIGWKVAPDGRSVAVLRYTESDPKLQQFYFDLMVLPLDHGKPRLLAQHIPQDYGICFNWSPNSSSIAYTTQERGARTQLFVVPTDGSLAPQEISNPKEELELLQGDVEAPRWSEDGQYLYCLAQRGCWAFAAKRSVRRHIPLLLNHDVIGWLQSPTSGTLWTPHPNTLLYLTRNPHTKDTGLALTDMESGESRLLTEFPMRAGCSPFEMEVSPERSSVYLFLERCDRAAEIWQLHDGYQQRKCLFSLNAQLKNTAL